MYLANSCPLSPVINVRRRKTYGLVRKRMKHCQYLHADYIAYSWPFTSVLVTGACYGEMLFFCCNGNGVHFTWNTIKYTRTDRCNRKIYGL